MMEEAQILDLYLKKELPKNVLQPNAAEDLSKELYCVKPQRFEGLLVTVTLIILHLLIEKRKTKNVKYSLNIATLFFLRNSLESHVILSIYHGLIIYVKVVMKSSKFTKVPSETFTSSQFRKESSMLL